MKKFFRNMIITATFMVTAFSVLNAEATVLYEERTRDVVSTGVTHVSIDRFTDKGWIDIQVLKLDTKNKYSSLTPLISPEGTSKRSTVTSMMSKDDKITSGINGDFFTYSNYPMALGSLYGDDKIISTTPELAFARNNFYIRKDGTSGVGHMPHKMFVQNITKVKTDHITAMNKLSSPYTSTFLLDENWGSTSPGSALGPNVVEVLVKDGKVVEKRKGGKGFNIDSDSYVLVQVGTNLDSYEPGDVVVHNLGSYDNLKFSIGGGNVLVKDKKIQKKDLNNTRSPRTAIGINEKGTEILMVTVDGRNGNSIGMTEPELAQFMYQIGCKDAINLDGGGSTTMAVKYSKEEPKVVNSPSEGSQRPVANGIGTRSDAPVSQPHYIKLSTETTDVYPEFGLKVNSGVYDVYHNKLDVDSSKINYTLDGVETTLDSLPLNTPGFKTLKGEYQGATGELKIYVHSPIVEICTNTEKLLLDNNETYEFKEFNGLDGQGYKKSIPKDRVSYEIHGDIGTINGHTFTSGKSNSTGAIEIKFGNISKFIPISVGFDTEELAKFNDQTEIDITRDPDDSSKVTARKSDSETGYNVDFAVTHDKSPRKAILDLKEPIAIGSGDELSLSLSGKIPTGTLVAHISDENNKNHTVELDKDLKLDGEKTVTVKLPTGTLTLDKLELIVTRDTQFQGNLELRNLSKKTATPIDQSYNELSDRLVDNRNYIGEEVTISVGTIGEGQSNKINHMSSGNIALSFDGKGLNDLKASKNLSGNKKYNVERTSDTVIITLENNGTSMRSTNSNQWPKFIKEVREAKEKNIIIISHNDPLKMKWDREIALFETILDKEVKNGKNIFLLTKGDSTDITLTNGYRKITVAPDNKVLDIYLKDGNMSYVLTNV